jgi:carboxylesterase type B
LRFRAPAPPEVNRRSIQTGSVTTICPQANPAWIIEQEAFIVDFLTNRPFNGTIDSFPNSGPIGAEDPRTSEDCLFLDLLVPQKVFDSAQKGRGRSKGVPVLLWIYGGGYTAGSKSSFNGAPFLTTSNNEVIFIAINYRLGAFGWLSGPSFQADGTSNAGLWDQRFALEWVQKYIHLFGGDKDRVTIFGESAGGGSVMHQITVGFPAGGIAHAFRICTHQTSN